MSAHAIRPRPTVVGFAAARTTTGARAAGRRLAAVWRKVQPHSLRVAGLGLMSASAFTVATWAGLLAAGLSCLVLEAVR